MNRLSSFCLFALLVCAAAPVLAQEVADGSVTGSSFLSFRGSMMLIPEDNGLESDPAPLMGVFGTALAFPLAPAKTVKGAEPLSLETSLDIYYTQYGYSDTLNRAVPLAIENRWTQVFGFVVGVQALLRFPIGEDTFIRVLAGPAADLRLCLVAADLNDFEMDEAEEMTKKVRQYFWSEGRWFVPLVGAGIDFNLNDAIELGFDIRVWFPIHKLWTHEDAPFIEGWRFGAGFRLGFR
ncbi:hypothetical protein ACYULU_08770 [Breznakiellaceae bacterium SP9]